MGRPKLIEDADLLDIARQVFRAHGHTATTQQVAHAAGVSEAALFKRFKTKDALFFAALNHGAADLSALTSLDPALPPRTYLLKFAVHTREHFRQAMPSILSVAAHPKYGREMMGRIHHYNRAGEIAAILRARFETWRADGAIRPASLIGFVHTFIHALHSTAMVDVISGSAHEPVKESELEPMIDTFWEAVRPMKQPRRTRRAR